MKLIGLTGHAASGKDDVARFLCETEGFVAIPFFNKVEIERLRNAPDYLHISGIVICDVGLADNAAWVRWQGGQIWQIWRIEERYVPIGVSRHRNMKEGVPGSVIDLVINTHNIIIEVLHELIHTIITNEEEIS